MFQCHKCRSINYDEKDPFLCNICGFCKYAKFEYTLTCRPCCAVDPIENEDDRKKSVSSINSLLDKADKVYKQLISNKPQLELFLLKIAESSVDAGVSTMGNSSMGTHVNFYIQQLAQKYCVECKVSFEELSKISQKVMATRKELLAFDNSRKKKVGSLSRGSSLSSEPTTPVKGANMSKTTTGKCYGCAAASVEHCLTLLRALATKPSSRTLLTELGLISELLESNLRHGSTPVRQEVRKLICFLTKDNLAATRHLGNLLMDKVSLAMSGKSKPYSDMVESVRHEINLLAYTIQREDSCWEERLKCVFRIFLLSTKDENTTPVVLDCITLPCLTILQGLIKPKSDPGPSDKSEIMASYKKLPIDISKWLEGDPEHCFESWDKRVRSVKMLSTKPSSGEKDGKKKEESIRSKRRHVQKPAMKKEHVRATYLTQKYGQRWLEGTFCKVGFPLDLDQTSWLRSILFCPTSGKARETACRMVEAFCNTHSRRKAMIDLLSEFLPDLRSAG